MTLLHDSPQIAEPAPAPAPAPTAPAAGPSMAAKLVRTFLFAFAGALVTALLPILDGLASGGKVDLSALGTVAVAAIVAAVSTGVRAVIAYLPVFADDDVGLRKPA